MHLKDCEITLERLREEASFVEREGAYPYVLAIYAYRDKEVKSYLVISETGALPSEKLFETARELQLHPLMRRYK